MWVGKLIQRNYRIMIDRGANRNPGHAVGPESWSNRYISDSLHKNALKCRPITSLEAKQFE